MTSIVFHHGALADTYEEQANKQGFTLGDHAEFAQRVGFGIVAAHIHGCITDSEYDKILRRFQTKILAKNLKKILNEDSCEEFEEGERMKSRVTEIGEAILDLIKIYTELKDDPYTKNPVARALYFTWKKYDIDKKVNK